LNDLNLADDPLTQTHYGYAGANPINFVEVDGHKFRGSLYLHELAIALTVGAIYAMHPGADITVGRYWNFIPKAGKHGGTGYADIILWSHDHSRAQVWEVKPDTPYGHATGGAQVQRCVEGLRALGVKATAGHPLPQRGPFALPSTATILVQSGHMEGGEAGVEFYRATPPLPKKIREWYERRIKELERKYAPKPEHHIHWGFDWKAGLKGAIIVTAVTAAILTCPETGGGTCAAAGAAG